jgi:hypothetical protein
MVVVILARNNQNYKEVSGVIFLGDLIPYFSHHFFSPRIFWFLGNYIKIYQTLPHFSSDKKQYF